MEEKMNKRYVVGEDELHMARSGRTLLVRPRTHFDASGNPLTAVSVVGYVDPKTIGSQGAVEYEPVPKEEREEVEDLARETFNASLVGFY